MSKKLVSVLVTQELYDKIDESAAQSEYKREPYLRQLLKRYFRYLEHHPECRDELEVRKWNLTATIRDNEASEHNI